MSERQLKTCNFKSTRSMGDRTTGFVGQQSEISKRDKCQCPLAGENPTGGGLGSVGKFAV